MPTFYVKQKNMLLLQRMFAVTPEEFKASPVDWDAFVTAAADTGLEISSIGGSEVGFARPGHGRHFVFHRPHKEGRTSKIHQIKFQMCGKLMKKHFGWDMDSFVDIKTRSAA